jgi:hypothetical protein
MADPRETVPVKPHRDPFEYYFGTGYDYTDHSDVTVNTVPQQVKGMAGSAQSNATLIADAIWVLAGRPEEFKFKEITNLAKNLSKEAIVLFFEEINYRFEVMFWVFVQHHSYEPWHTAMDSMKKIDISFMKDGSKSEDEVSEELKAFQDKIGGIKFPDTHPDIKMGWDHIFLEESCHDSRTNNDWELWACQSYALCSVFDKLSIPVPTI